MTTARRIDRPTLWLGLGAALAMAMTALPWLFGPAGKVTGAGSAPAAPSAMGAPSALPPLEDLRATRAQPLFAADRRPLPGAAPASPGYELIGIVGVGQDRRALIRLATGTLVLAEGDRLGEWVLQSVEIERIVLSRAADRLILSIGSRTPAEFRGVSPTRGGSQ